MKRIDLYTLEDLYAGDAVDAFCAGFGAVAAVYAGGLLLNLWNPIGATAATATAIIGIGCAAKALM